MAVLKSSVIIFLAVTLALDHGDSARILGLFPIPIKSHMISFSTLMQELAHRGHQVTVVGGFPVQPPIANYTDITLHSSLPENVLPNMFKMTQEMSGIKMITFMLDMVVQWCERELQHPQVRKLIEDKELKFDVIIFETFFSECFYGLIHKYKVPVIHINSNTAMLALGDGVGNVYTPSYIPDSFLGFSSKMTFVQRLQNTLMNVFIHLSREFYYLPKQNALIQKHFNDPSIPPIQEMEKNTSLFLLNTHFSLGYPRPLTPNTIEVGGMHIKPGNKLPKDIQKIMDEAQDGVVYFSLGSNVRNKDMPADMRQAFLDVFAKLKQRVLWKWEADSIPGLPENVHIAKWLPQNDILVHPNLRVFMTHGGLLSTQEATYHGVPLLAIPVAGDQVVNAAGAQAKGYAVVLDLTNITAKSLGWALDEILNNPRYRDNVKRMSALLRDQPQTPLEKAVYWTEYVIRHRGAPHMRSAALDLYWFQYYLLDVLAVLLGSAVLCITIIWVLSCTLYRLLFSQGTRTLAHKRSKKTN